jgi:hypothetical protein
MLRLKLIARRQVLKTKSKTDESVDGNRTFELYIAVHKSEILYPG